MRTVAIIQARMSSTRLPHKVLKDLCGESVLARVVRRVQRCRTLDDVWVATSLNGADDSLVAEAERLGVTVFRGNENDVLDRYYQTARDSRADVIVRLTSDCPLIDPDVSDEVVRAFRTQEPDYASNALVRTYPRGLDTEVIAFLALERAWREAQAPHHRTHVTPYLYENPDQFKLLSVTCPENHSAHRWTLDTEADLVFMRAVYGRFQGNDKFTWHDVLDVVQKRPELEEINCMVRQKALVEC